jgi:hypothetical protein
MNRVRRRTLIAILAAVAAWPMVRRFKPRLLEQRGLIVRDRWIVKGTDR